MSWTAIAIKEYQDAIRAKRLVVLTALFVGFAALVPVLFYRFVSDPKPADMAAGVVFPGFLFVMIVGLMIGYRAVSAERESGSIRLLLALPHTRRDVVIGKLLGRTAVLSTALLLAFGVASVLILALFQSYTWLFAVMFPLLMLYGLVCISCAIAFSSMTTSHRSMMLTLGFVAMFLFLWGTFLRALYVVFGGGSPSNLFFSPEEKPTWMEVLELANPVTAISETLNLVDDALLGGVGGEELTVHPYAELAPLYLLFWLVVPLTVGYLVFKRKPL